MTSKLIEARKIWDIDKNWGGKGITTGGEVHPDLIRYKGHWYCGFKESGRSRIIRSADGTNWETVKLFDWNGGFFGRPYLSITAEGQLMVNAWIRPRNREGSQPVHNEEKKLGKAKVAPVRVFSVTLFSSDGTTWTEATATNVDLLFSVTWHNSLCYAVSQWRDGLHYSMDGKTWHMLKEDFFPRHDAALSYDKHDLSVEPGTKMVGCNETALYFDPADDTAYALTRTNPICVILGKGKGPDYQEWEWRDVKVDWNGDGVLHKPEDVMGVQLGCPVLKQLSDGRMFGIGRADVSDATTNRCRIVLFWVDLENAVLTPFAKIDDYGGYSGVVEHDGFLWVACSNATRPAFDVFMLKVAIPPAK